MESNGVTVTRKAKHTTETRNPISQSRTVLITRTAPGSPNLIGSSIKAESHRSSFIAPSSGRNLVNTGVSKFLEGRGKEKKDMQELNQRFGNYIEKVSNRTLFSRKKNCVVQRKYQSNTVLPAIRNQLIFFSGVG